MTHHLPPLPDHTPLKPCPFCGRPGSAVSHQAAPNVPVTYSVGCWRDLSPYAQEPFWEDCLGPQTDWTPQLDHAVELWNRRALRGVGRDRPYERSPAATPEP